MMTEFSFSLSLSDEEVSAILWLLLLGAICAAFIYGAFAVWANERATKAIAGKELEISKFLSFHGLSLVEVANRDDAPFEVRFSVFHTNGSALPSRIFWRLLKKAKKTGDIWPLVRRCQEGADQHAARAAKRRGF